MKNLFAIVLVLVSFNLPAGTDQKLNVFVSIPPQKYFVEKIGGGRVTVNVMLAPGQNPETFEPRPRQIRMLSNAQLYFRIGVPFENNWLDIMKAQSDEIHFIECCTQLMLDQDPHIWTSLKNARFISRLIFESLAGIDPEGLDMYENNFQALLQELDELDEDISNILKDSGTSYFIVSHDSWNYFARDYGLHQLAIESSGREKGPRGLVQLIEIAKREEIKTVFIQQQHPLGPARTIARELNANIVVIDPLAENYIENLREVSKKIAGVIK